MEATRPFIPSSPSLSRQQAYSPAAVRNAEFHKEAIDQISRETGLRIEEIKELYERVLLALAKQAKIQDYLPVLVVKHVKRILKHQEEQPDTHH